MGPYQIKKLGYEPRTLEHERNKRSDEKLIGEKVATGVESCCRGAESARLPSPPGSHRLAASASAARPPLAESLRAAAGRLWIDSWRLEVWIESERKRSWNGLE